LIDLQSALEVCRFLHNASLMYLWGASAFLCILVPRPLADVIWRKFGRAPLIAAFIAVATTVVYLPLEAGSIGEGWQATIDPGTVHDVLFETTVGWAWRVQAVAAAFLAISLIAPRRMRMASIAFGAAVGLASLALTGHASMHQGWLALMHRCNDVVHVLSGGAWLGALVPLVAILGLLDRDDHRAEAQMALRRFSNAGHAAVALVIISGIINTLLVLQHLPTDWSSRYQLLLAAKIALVLGMAGLAIGNRYVLVPRIGKSPTRTIDAIKFGSIAEIALGLFAVALVAVFGLLEPI
jgi:putative copper resistance protein D